MESSTLSRVHKYWAMLSVQLSRTSQQEMLGDWCLPPKSCLSLKSTALFRAFEMVLGSRLLNPFLKEGTYICTSMAREKAYNFQTGKKVHFYSLQGEDKYVAI